MCTSSCRHSISVCPGKNETRDARICSLCLYRFYNFSLETRFAPGLSLLIFVLRKEFLSLTPSRLFFKPRGEKPGKFFSLELKTRQQQHSGKKVFSSIQTAVDFLISDSIKLSAVYLWGVRGGRKIGRRFLARHVLFQWVVDPLSIVLPDVRLHQILEVVVLKGTDPDFPVRVLLQLLLGRLRDVRGGASACRGLEGDYTGALTH